VSLLPTNPPVPSVSEPLVPTEFARLKPKTRRPHDSQRLDHRDENDLLAHLLASSREIDLTADEDSVRELLEAEWNHRRRALLAARKGDDLPSVSAPLERLLSLRPDLKGLPLLLGSECLLDRDQSRVLAHVSRAVREVIALREQKKATRLPVHDLLCELLIDTQRGTSEPELLVRPFEHLYQVESEKVRASLVATFGLIEGKEAIQALARRAIFDPSHSVRKEALFWISGKLHSTRTILLSALRHPWAPAAEHAAEALVALKDTEAIPYLREILAEPDPTAPFFDTDSKWKRKELVRINHLRNCLLCHPSSGESKDPLRTVVPTPGQPLPDSYLDSMPQRNSRRRLLNADSFAAVKFVRADVVYFRQDFSATHRVKNPNKWPEIQRFDYLIQTRELSDAEADALLKKTHESKSYPQREAVRWALAKLSGEK